MTRLRYAATFLIAVITIVGSQPARSQSEAPFGLTWGVSADDLRAIGVDLRELPEKTFGISYAASKLPKVLADQEATLLSFGFDNKLWRVIGLGKQVENDPYGAAVKERYQELLGLLAEKYGKSRSVHTLGGSIYSEPRYFIAGIRGGESSWFSNFSTTETDVQLSLTATDSSTARWRVIFEYKPLKRKFEADRKGREKGAL
jgi:hypothetical protein